MQIQRVQNNNYNNTFGAKVTIFDANKIIPKDVKRTFTQMCRGLGEDTDEIFLGVYKGNNKIGELETDIFSGEVKEGFVHNYYEFDFNIDKEVITGQIFDKRNSFIEDLPVWTNREYSMPRNLAKIYKDYILPMFEDNSIIIKNLGDTAETKLLSAAEKSKIKGVK